MSIRSLSSAGKVFFSVLVFSFFICPASIYGAASIPLVAGPLKVTEESYPFCAAARTIVPQDLSRLGYVEEEFLVSGKANIYDFDSAGKVAVKTPDAPYTTRILVRRPAATKKFSGNVIVELLNPSFGYDLDLEWMFSREHFVEHGDIWIGLTVKPVAAKALKKFDPQRYAAISWANPLPPGKACPIPASSLLDTVPETENGLAWDIISQVGALVRSSEKQNPLKGFKVEYVYATGYSQTAGYLTTYINFICPLPGAMLQSGRPVYDGYLLGDGDAFAAVLNQCLQAFPQGASAAIIRPRKEPVLSIVTENLLSMTIPARRPDSDAANDRYRRYEVPGAVHAHKRVMELVPRPEDTARAGISAIPAPDCMGPDKYGLTDFHFEYLMNAAFANLDAWVRSNLPPPRAQFIETVRGGDSSSLEVKVDEHGNALGGLRTPYLDIPVATYYAQSKPADEKSARLCSTQGYKVPFEKGKMLALYPTHESYWSKVSGMVDAMVKERSFTEADGAKIKKEAELLSVW